MMLPFPQSYRQLCYKLRNYKNQIHFEIGGQYVALIFIYPTAGKILSFLFIYFVLFFHASFIPIK